MDKRKIAVIAAVAAAAALAWNFRAKKPFLYAATIEATEIDLSARISGQITGYGAEEGGSVKKGRTLVSLDCDDAKLAADIARKDYERAVGLHESGSLSRENFDRLKYRSDDAALRASWCVIKSPVDGKMLYKHRENGELVQPGTKLATVADLSEVYGWVYVPHDMIAKLSTGMEVTGYLPELGQKEFPGKIAVVNDEAEFTPKNVQTRKERTRLVFGVKVVFKNPENLLKPGMTVEVRLPE
ncbi:MAG: efflux RND transporter periplasmic adaptor subunit [Elusimicrobiales bacterium]